MKWNELQITVDGITSNLGDVVNNAINGRDTLGAMELTTEGGVRTWDGVFVHAVDQVPEWDSLQSIDVDWSGFATAVDAARATEHSQNDGHASESHYAARMEACRE